MIPRQKPCFDVRPDEWGVYDPEQAGLAAVLDHLESRLEQLRLSEPTPRAAAMRDAHARRKDSK